MNDEELQTEEQTQELDDLLAEEYEEWLAEVECSELMNML